MTSERYLEPSGPASTAIWDATLELFILEEQLDAPPQCESFLHNIEWAMEPHEAHWETSAPCGGAMAVCEKRRRKCREDDGWRCTTGCSGFHPYDHIEWTPIDRRH